MSFSFGERYRRWLIDSAQLALGLYVLAQIIPLLNEWPEDWGNLSRQSP